METNRLLDLFCELARIESPSRREAAMAARCARELRDLGFQVRFDASAAQTGSDTGNLIAHLPGTAPRSLVLSAHMDTVQPCAGIEPAVVDGVVRSVGDTILSADDKAGVAAILEGVRRVVEAGSERPDVTVLLTTCEEVHLLGSGALAEGELPEGAPCYVLDAAGAPGTVITGAPCHWSFEARFLGKAAMTAALEDAAARFGGAVEVDWEKSYDAVLYDEEDEVVRDVAAAARAAGLAVRLQHDGGGSDANVLCARGVRAVALGVGMAAFHSTDEHIAVADLEGSARLVEALITQAARS